MTETIVVYVAHYWGKGSTLAEAQQSLRDAGGQLGDGYTVLTFDADTVFEGVDQMGRYHYRHRDGQSDPNPPTEKVVKPKGRSRA